jgi:hypothetical protein
MAKKRASARPKKKGAVLRKDVREVIERVWPEGIVDMTFDADESYFWEIQSKLKRAFAQISKAQLLHEHEAEGRPLWPEESDPDENSPSDIEHCRSYHLFFICPEGEAFTFETEAENIDEEALAVEFEAGKCGSEPMITVHGCGWTGWSVAISLPAPLAVITLNEMSKFDDGSTSDPGVEMCILNLESDPIDPEEHFKETAGLQAFAVLEKLRTVISGILEKNGIAVLPEEEWRKPVSWLQGGEEALVGKDGEPIRVLDAFFFEGL